jgi:hypothetical protein
VKKEIVVKPSSYYGILNKAIQELKRNTVILISALYVTVS